MTFKFQRVVIASLGAVALMLTTSEISARPSGARAGTTANAAGHRPLIPTFHNNRRGFGPLYYPGSTIDDTSYAQAPVETTQPASRDMHYTYTYDVPWDWAHRMPPQVAPSDRAYVPSCQVDNVVVPGRSGAEHTVNVTRCY